VLLNTTAPGATTPSFAPAVEFVVGNPYSVAVGDLNGDGRPDIVVANQADYAVSVMLNTTAPGATTPSFAPKVDFATGGGPISVAIGDLNGDGRPDLVAANFGEGTVSVLLNTTIPGAATPSFAAPQTFASYGGPISVAVGDLNGDGKPDLAAANFVGTTVSVFLNTTMPGATTPSFAPQLAFPVGFGEPQSVAISDLNGDGQPDLVVANFTSSTASVLLNTTAPGATTPSFAPKVDFATGPNPKSVAIADLNGDGKPDLIAADYNTNSVSVLLNITAPGAATPSFAPRVDFTTGMNASSVAIADFNGDGRPDLAVANTNSNNVSVLLNMPETITTATAVGTIIESPLTPNQHFVAALYRDELGRAADLSNPQDAGGFVNALDSGALSQAVVAEAVLRSPEARDHLVQGWYVAFLGRPAGGGEEQGWVNALLAGRTEEAVLSQILGSTEFYARAQTLISAGSADERYVQALYLLLLNRTGESAGAAAWLGALPQLGRPGVALGFLQSPEFRTDHFEGYYNALLHRPADAAGLNGWVFSNLDIGAVRIGFESSPEFFLNG
jgi:FG-GAP-like repeat/Domain of unknown function (DUF4214)/FG-GAP repeat